MIAPRNSRDHLVVLAAGGTGGHVFPAEALAQELLAQGYRLALITDQRGTAYSGTLGMIETRHIAARGVAGQGVMGAAKAAFALTRGFFSARHILRELRPAAVVGFGGYAAAPTVAAATNLGIRTIIHEQNAVLGRANRLLASRASRVCASFELARRAPKGANVVQTGMPVRPGIAAMRNAPYEAPTPGGPFKILILGGSQGARVFSDVVPAAMAKLPEGLRQRVEISQQCRAEELDRTHVAYHDAGVHVTLKVFFDNVPELMAGAHLLISRSGASTVAEAAAIGRPTILVPYPYATDDHQTANAQIVMAAGAGWMMRQPDFTPDALAQRIAQFAAAPYGLAGAAAAAANLGVPDAAKRLADVVTSVIRGENSARLDNAASASAPPINTNRMNRGIV